MGYEVVVNANNDPLKGINISQSQSKTESQASKLAKEIQALKEKIQWLQEPEAGDFRRKAGLYLLQFERTLTVEEKKRFLKDLRAAENAVMFDPSPDLEVIRRSVMSVLDRMGNSARA